MKAMDAEGIFAGMAIDVETGRRIKELRRDILKITQSEFADMLGGVTRGAVGNWELGQGIKRENLSRMSARFDVSFEWLATGAGQPRNGALTKPANKPGTVSMVPVIGFVKAGTWQDIEEWGALEVADYVPSTGDFPADWQFALVVDGNSVNRAARHGDWLICVDLIKSQIDIGDDDLVVVERARYDGQMVERTAKRVKRTLSGMELWPDSDDPAHQEPIAYRTNGEKDEVRITAKVIWVLRKP